MKPMTEATERMIKGRIGLIAREPFFAQLALEKLTLVEDAKCKTTWTDGRRLGFNPEYVLAADSIGKLEAVWAHHVATCALGHPFRRGARKEDKWNEASDHVVNDYIQKAGFALPEGSLYDPRFDGMYVEQVYKLLTEEQEGDDDGQGTGGAGSAPGAGSDASRGNDVPEAGSAPAGSGRGDPSESGEGPGDGAGVDATGEVRDATSEDGASEDQPASPSELADQADDWRTAVAQAEQAARGAGKIGGETERLAKAARDAKVNWAEALQRLLKARAKEDYTLRRPHRRSYLIGAVMPSLMSEACGTLAFGIDYSGSTTQENINQFTTEVEEARLALNPERVIVYVFDDGIRQTLEFGPGEPIEVPAVRAGGGTSFVHPVLACNELEIEPEVLVFLTDLDSSKFAPEPTYPVVWVTTGKTFAPYGDVIQMI